MALRLQSWVKSLSPSFHDPLRFVAHWNICTKLTSTAIYRTIMLSFRVDLCPSRGARETDKTHLTSQLPIGDTSVCLPPKKIRANQENWIPWFPLWGRRFTHQAAKSQGLTRSPASNSYQHQLEPRPGSSNWTDQGNQKEQKILS